MSLRPGQLETWSSTVGFQAGLELEFWFFKLEALECRLGQLKDVSSRLEEFKD